jgi:surfeit locus 1 family protein
MIGFKPKLIPTLFTIPALIVLFGLSIWQFQRLEWKENIIAEITEQSKVLPIALPKLVQLPNMFYRKVIASGEFLHDHEIHMYGGSRQFKGEPGYYILTPMKLRDEQIILINRGWVPERLKNSSKRPETLTTGEVEIIGTIMPTEQRNLYIHDNQKERNLWFYVNLNEVRDFLKMPIGDFYILARDEPNILPRGRDLEPSLRNHHLGYALTWLFSAFALIFIYIRFHKKNP